ncbi:MAG: enolase C-terminal domain-like protein [Trueperaceae bacterium]
MFRKLKDFHLPWIEEPVTPGNLDGYAKIRASMQAPISDGEHKFTRWGFQNIIEKKLWHLST